MEDITFECKYSTFEELPEIDGVDWISAKKYHADICMLLMLLSEYSKNIEKRALELEEYCGMFPEKNAVEGFKISIHSVKGTSAWIGAVHISEIARLLESYAKEDKLELIKAELPEFLKEYRKLYKDISLLLTQVVLQ